MPADQLLARVAEHLAEAAVDELQRAVVVDLRQPFPHPLDQQAVACLAPAQGALDAGALQRSGEDLPHHVQQRDVLFHPGVLAHDGVETDRAEEPAARRHRHGERADVAGAGVYLALPFRVERQVLHARDVDVVETAEPGERELEFLDGCLLQVGGTRSHARGAPLVGDGEEATRLVELGDEAAVGAEERADLRQRLDDRAIQLVRSEIDEVRRDRGDELFELDAMLQRLLELAPLAGVDGEGHQVGDRAGEVLLLGSPGAGAADVLVADHTRDLPEVPEGRVEHRRDPERQQVLLGEVARARVMHGIVGRDGAGALQGAEVGRVVARRQLEARGVPSRGPLEEIGATDGVPVGRVEPDADALDFERLGCRDGDVPQRRLEIAGMDAGALRQLDENIVLPPRPRLGGEISQDVGFGQGTAMLRWEKCIPGER